MPSPSTTTVSPSAESWTSAEARPIANLPLSTVGKRSCASTTWKSPAPLQLSTLRKPAWCIEKSWCFSDKNGHLGFKKRLPLFRSSAPSPVDRKCKCGGGVYRVPQVDDVPLLLRNLTKGDIRVLHSFDIQCGDYKHIVHGYRQRTGTFRISWSALLVTEKIQAIEDLPRRRRLQETFNFLMAKVDSSYRKFVVMQSRGVAQQFPYKIFSAPEVLGIECALWPSLYHTNVFWRGHVMHRS